MIQRWLINTILYILWFKVNLKFLEGIYGKEIGALTTLICASHNIWNPRRLFPPLLSSPLLSLLIFSLFLSLAHYQSMAAGTAFKPISMAEGLLPYLPAAFFSSKPSLAHLPLLRSSRPLPFLHLSCSRSSSSISLRRKLPLLPLVAQTSDWASQEEEEQEASEVEDRGFGLEGFDEGDEPGLSELEGEEVQAEDSGVVAQGEGEFVEGEEEEEEEAYVEPPEEAKLFVGNLPYDFDSEKLAHLFEEAGVVEVAEVEEQMGPF